MQSVLIGAVDSTRVALEVLASMQAAPQLVMTFSPEIGYRRHSDYINLAPLCERLEIPCTFIEAINDTRSLELLSEHEPDYVFVIGWSQICHKALLDIPKRGAIGCHPALLPVNRGRAVIPWTILQGASETGTTLFWLDEGVDSGPILCQQRFSVSGRETAGSLYNKHLEAINNMLRHIIPLLQSGLAPAFQQTDDQATYCARRTPQDGYINWQQSAHAIDCLVRASSRPYPGAFTFIGRAKILVWSTEFYVDDRYSAVPGQILYLNSGRPVVRCGDGINLLLSDYEVVPRAESGDTSNLKPHQRLGLPPLWTFL